MNPQQWKSLVGDAIAQRRRLLGIRSMRKAAALANISEGTWRHVETGRRKILAEEVAPSPSGDTKAAICKVLGWSADGIDELLQGRRPALRPATFEEAAALSDDPVPIEEAVEDLQDRLADLESRVALLEQGPEVSHGGRPGSREATLAGSDATAQTIRQAGQARHQGPRRAVPGET